MAEQERRRLSYARKFVALPRSKQEHHRDGSALPEHEPSPQQQQQQQQQQRRTSAQNRRTGRQAPPPSGSEWRRDRVPAWSDRRPQPTAEVQVLTQLHASLTREIKEERRACVRLEREIRSLEMQQHSLRQRSGRRVGVNPALASPGRSFGTARRDLEWRNSRLVDSRPKDTANTANEDSGAERTQPRSQTRSQKHQARLRLRRELRSSTEKLQRLQRDEAAQKRIHRAEVERMKALIERKEHELVQARGSAGAHERAAVERVERVRDAGLQIVSAVDAAVRKLGEDERDLADALQRLAKQIPAAAEVYLRRAAAKGERGARSEHAVPEDEQNGTGGREDLKLLKRFATLQELGVEEVVLGTSGQPLPSK